ncbi:hypothetical protein H310_09593 [Aphanomyces invadans]|uniref:Uncharacterized protein n=1 Tax=Aphanomyces invadans TaxID=157072 RepID=A0A024TUP5_9STRA|nr:hypothetical protein H310_09593 [Aphanomyces invadans]ETV97709.1 hypothetical protein H310_09593 [Aphanomyces invadans]RHY28653.1 hypothetical protein DYB32_006272 [Aphanomyces invadans]|eukprot:XP_008873918.1 hypothetical protein H310_09593 [Aphanomyces invadans]
MAHVLRWLLLVACLVLQVTCELPTDLRVRREMVPVGKPHPNANGEIVQDTQEVITVVDPEEEKENRDKQASGVVVKGGKFKARRQFIFTGIAAVVKGVTLAAKLTKAVSVGAKAVKVGATAAKMGKVATGAGKVAAKAKKVGAVLNKVQGVANKVHKVANNVRNGINHVRNAVQRPRGRRH